MLKNKDYLEAIEKQDEKKVQFRTEEVKIDQDEKVIDYKFNDGTIVRETCRLLGYYANSPNKIIWGNQLKRRVEFIEPIERKGKQLKPDEVYDD